MVVVVVFFFFFLSSGPFVGDTWLKDFINAHTYTHTHRQTPIGGWLPLGNFSSDPSKTIFRYRCQMWELFCPPSRRSFIQKHREACRTCRQKRCHWVGYLLLKKKTLFYYVLQPIAFVQLLQHWESPQSHEGAYDG